MINIVFHYKGLAATREIMGTIYDIIYDMAKPYLDTRKNDIHISLSLMFARQLLEHYPDADEDIVLPAVILHDVGWKIVPEEKQSGAFGPNTKDTETRRLHEIEGAKIAREILRSINYDELKIAEITAIIDGHDSRKQALSLNDSLVKDTDKLWRFTPIGVDIDHTRFGIDRNVYITYLDSIIEQWFFTPEAGDMAREALDETKSLQI
ncbi:MAG: HD domain-containing protein [Proteobacteria bacterium]|nr:HD domain-containing protein [Pseudomonadota bacterium]